MIRPMLDVRCTKYDVGSTKYEVGGEQLNGEVEMGV
jgi:hypothetical protein